MLQKWVLFPGSRKLIFPPGRPLNSFSYNRVAESYRLIESCFSGSFLYVSTVSNLSFAKNFPRHWSVGPKFIWILSSLTENMFPFMFYAYKKNPPCILKKKEWKAFFIKASMCRVRRAGSLLSADQLVLPVFKVTDGITPPSPPPLQSCFLSHISACDMYNFFLNTFLSVLLSCAAEAKNTLPAAFSLVEKATGPGSRIIQASLTSRECDCWSSVDSESL